MKKFSNDWRKRGKLAITKESVFKRDVRASNTYAKRKQRVPSLPKLKCLEDKLCD